MRASQWQLDNGAILKKSWPSVGRSFMRLAFASRSSGQRRQNCDNRHRNGDFEVDENIVPATNRLFERLPDAQPWVIRLGHRAVDHFGARSLKKNP